MKFSARTTIYLMICFGLLIFGGWYFGVSERQAGYDRIALVQVQPSQVSISWNSAEPEIFDAEIDDGEEDVVEVE